MKFSKKELLECQDLCIQQIIRDGHRCQSAATIELNEIMDLRAHVIRDLIERYGDE